MIPRVVSVLEPLKLKKICRHQNLYLAKAQRPKGYRHITRYCGDVGSNTGLYSRGYPALSTRPLLQ